MEKVETQQYALENMPAHSRVWVYKSSRAFSSAESKMILSNGIEFIDSWTAHGSQMQAAIGIEADRFIIIAADEQATGATGCSIDASVQFIKSLEHELNTTLTNRMFLVYEGANGTSSCSLNELPTLITEGILTLDSLVYDDLIASIDDYRTRFKIPLRESWAIKFTD